MCATENGNEARRHQSCLKVLSRIHSLPILLSGSAVIFGKDRLDVYITSVRRQCQLPSKVLLEVLSDCVRATCFAVQGLGATEGSSLGNDWCNYVQTYKTMRFFQPIGRRIQVVDAPNSHEKWTYAEDATMGLHSATAATEKMTGFSQSTRFRQNKLRRVSIALQPRYQYAKNRKNLFQNAETISCANTHCIHVRDILFERPPLGAYSLSPRVRNVEQRYLVRLSQQVG